MGWISWLCPGINLKRWLLLFSAGVMLVSLGLALVFNYKYLDHIEEAIFRFVYTWKGTYDYTATALVGRDCVCSQGRAPQAYWPLRTDARAPSPAPVLRRLRATVSRR